MERSMSTSPSSMTDNGSKDKGKDKCKDKEKDKGGKGSSDTFTSSTTSTSINKRKATTSMQSSLDIIRNSLLCPICNSIMKEPSTLPCSHSFCKACIADHTRKSWTCPLPNCQLPVSNRGGSKSSISTNPQLTSVISSLHNIVSSLNSASDEWWKQHNRNRNWQKQQQQQQQVLPPSPHKNTKRNHKTSKIFDDIEIETPPPIKKQKHNEKDDHSNSNNSQCSGSTTTNDNDSTSSDFKDNCKSRKGSDGDDNGDVDGDGDGDNTDNNNTNNVRGGLNGDSLVDINDNDGDDDDDDKTQCYVFDDDGEETQQAYSIEDQPYSMIEVDDDDDDDDGNDNDSGSTTQNEDSQETTMENDNNNDNDNQRGKGTGTGTGGNGSGDDKNAIDNNATQRRKRLRDVVNHDSFIESPPLSASNDQNATRATSRTKTRTRTRTNTKTPTDSPKTINNEAVTALNKSCAIPLGASPKLSPIASVQSQHSVDNSIDNVEDTYAYGNLDGSIQSQRQSEVSFNDENKIINKDLEQQEEERKQGPTVEVQVSFMDIFHKLLHKIDCAHGEEQLSCNNGLFQDYCIYLIGDFDDYFAGASTSTSKSTSSTKQKQQNEEQRQQKGQAQAGQQEQLSFTRGRICLLLNLCGAQVKDVAVATTTRTTTSSKKIQNNVIVVPDTNPTTECREQVQYFVQSQKGNRRSNRRRDHSYVVVTCQWIFDSIHAFDVKDYDDYAIEDR